jgi:serine/threonine protein kinase
LIDQQRKIAVTLYPFFVGTPDYASPEAVNYDKFTSKTDVYSAAGSIHTLLTGNPPISVERSWDEEGNLETPEEFKKRQFQAIRFNSPHEREGCNLALDDLLRKCLSKKRENRPSPLEFNRGFRYALEALNSPRERWKRRYRKTLTFLMPSSYLPSVTKRQDPYNSMKVWDPNERTTDDGEKTLDLI